MSVEPPGDSASATAVQTMPDEQREPGPARGRGPAPVAPAFVESTVAVVVVRAVGSAAERTVVEAVVGSGNPRLHTQVGQDAAAPGSSWHPADGNSSKFPFGSLSGLCF